MGLQEVDIVCSDRVDLLRFTSFVLGPVAEHARNGFSFPVLGFVEGPPNEEEFDHFLRTFFGYHSDSCVHWIATCGPRGSAVCKTRRLPQIPTHACTISRLDIVVFGLVSSDRNRAGFDQWTAQTVGECVCLRVVCVYPNNPRCSNRCSRASSDCQQKLDPTLYGRLRCKYNSDIFNLLTTHLAGKMDFHAPLSTCQPSHRGFLPSSESPVADNSSKNIIGLRLASCSPDTRRYLHFASSPRGNAILPICHAHFNASEHCSS